VASLAELSFYATIRTDVDILMTLPLDVSVILLDVTTFEVRGITWRIDRLWLCCMWSAEPTGTSDLRDETKWTRGWLMFCVRFSSGREPWIDGMVTWSQVESTMMSTPSVPKKGEDKGYKVWSPAVIGIFIRLCEDREQIIKKCVGLLFAERDDRTQIDNTHQDRKSGTEN